MEFKDLSIDSESNRFDEHLNTEENSRIIFSGIFGIGKTYFLKKYFSSKSDDYVVVKLNPINYSVSSNEDIFELIKFDIGFELFSKNPDFEKIDFDLKSVSENYLLENYDSIINELIEHLPKLDHSIESIFKPILNLYKEIQKHRKELKIDDRKELHDFLKTFAKKEGTYREENSITELLGKLIDSIKLNNEDKKIILLIDDLDRIDPEHIFRIMNVFSAHFDHYNFDGENKFGFDKIVLVCDVDNLRSIFHSKYGMNIDFSGYIDKFYSHEVFHYNFSNVIAENLDKFLNSLDLSKTNLTPRTFSGSYEGTELEFILSHLVKSNCLSMRTLLNYLKSELTVPNYGIKTNSIEFGHVYSHASPIIVILHILENIFGGKQNFNKALEKLIAFKPSIQLGNYYGYYDKRVGNLVMLADVLHSNLSISNEVYLYENLELDIKVTYQIHQGFNYTGVSGKAIIVANFHDNLSDKSYEQKAMILKQKIPYFQLLKLAYNNMNYITKLNE
ncbi:hypothetical protein DMZ43_13620 [Meridianimaribacter sp. CL38]|uniref:P-loop NTPase fold protein n=1 Tax=Meridianimaribacter sp. CL38 TaxID=2213021 RepID=UPI00103ABD03|nr:P-loop NTPase fold protein [Meridianimaribacter sp. CL38]TBV24911.1 hypothetical protein DMZ43_13620 [Meridianimaribacter sp. CL38]